MGFSFAVLAPAGLGWWRCPVARFLHHPCPSCGMSRAIALLAIGRLHDSLRMHPLAAPALVAILFLVAGAVEMTLRTGSPAGMHRRPLGRAAIGYALVVYALALIVWGARALGALGGPVPVS